MAKNRKKMLKLIQAKPFVRVFDNSVDPFIPKLWANESLAILEENMVIANLVHRDFEPVVANFGDLVHTRRPGEFVAKRKTNADSVDIQDATATDVTVPLNQHVHVSFLIKDGEESKSFKDLVEIYMAPAMLAQARFIDKILLGQYAQFLDNVDGGLGQLSASNAKSFILDTRGRLNRQKAYMDGRNFIWNPNSETEVLKTDMFLQAYSVGDLGGAMREAALGRKLGFDHYMAQNMSSIATGNTVALGAVDNGSGYPEGTTVLTVDTFSGVVTVGTWIVIDGDNTPYRVVASSGSPTTSLTIHTGLRHAVLNNAVITAYTPGAVNFASGYAAGYSKEITVNGFTVAPRVGQVVTFGTSTTPAIYTIIGVNALVGITLDRPLDAAISHTNAVNIGPAGDYNFAFHRNALALVVRPLAQPKTGVGALSAVVNYNNLSMRATITYQGQQQGHLVTLDMLCGVAILDTNLGAVLLG